MFKFIFSLDSCSKTVKWPCKLCTDLCRSFLFRRNKPRLIGKVMKCKYTNILQNIIITNKYWSLLIFGKKILISNVYKWNVTKAII